MAKSPKEVTTITHDDAKRTNIPTAEYQPLVHERDQQAKRVMYERRNPDLDPQLVWRGKDQQQWADLVVQAPPIYIQEKVHPKVLIDDLVRQTQLAEDEDIADGDDLYQPDLFADFNGLPEDPGAKTEFYEHEGNWSNRMILGDSLQVMASLAEREGLRGQVQCIYLDPPYGIKFNSNFQWSTKDRDVKDGKTEHITREPEQVKAFRDTWRDGIHSYLTYLRDRLTVARDLLTESGSIFVQIGDENVHRVRALMDEVFGEENQVATISFQKTGSTDESLVSKTVDYLLFYARSKKKIKYRQLFLNRESGSVSLERYDQVLEDSGELRAITKWERLDPSTLDGKPRVQMTSLTSARPLGAGDLARFECEGKVYRPGSGTFKTDEAGLRRLVQANRAKSTGKTLRYVRHVDDFSVLPLADRWESVQLGTGLTYVVQTSVSVVERCILMATDPGDLVLDPTCGSGTTAYAAEQWGRRWITVDTSRVALALARARIMGARHPYYMLSDSPEGKAREAKITRAAPSDTKTHGNIRHGFVYERVPHIMLKDIANNAEIDVIYDEFKAKMEPLREQINAKRGLEMEEWEMPRDPGDPWPPKAVDQWERFQRVTTDTTKQKAVNRINKILGRQYTIETLPDQPVDPWEDQELIDLHTKWWELRIARQKEIDASIAAKADFEYLYDKPYEDKSKVRVAGPFTVESLSPHRTLIVDADDSLIDPRDAKCRDDDSGDFERVILDNLETAGVQQAHKDDRITFTTLTPWPGRYICAEGRYEAGDSEKRAGIFIGPEFGTVGRQDLVTAAREAADAGFDVVIACAFNFEAHATDFDTLGRIQILKARMNADLHMAEDLKKTDKGNLFVIFGEPDIELIPVEPDQLQIKLNGVDVFDPTSGEIRSDDPDTIACWFIDTDYNDESFFVRQAYFLGANDPYKSLKTTLKAEINEEAWDTLNSDTSRPFKKPSTGRIAVKVINHLGDEVMKVYEV